MSPDLYPVEMFWSDEDEGFIALAPDLPGCSAFGESREGAIAELRSAMEAWIGAAQAAGNPVPPPTRRDMREQASGRLLLRMPKSQHASLIDAARRDGVSLNTYIVMKLAAATAASSVIAEIREIATSRTARTSIRVLTQQVDHPLTRPQVTSTGARRIDWRQEFIPSKSSWATDVTVRGSSELQHA